MKFAIALVSCLLLMAGAAIAAQPAMITANVIHDQTQGVLRVNGVPVQRFSSTPAADSGPLTDAVGIGQWLVEGDNVIEVEATGPAGKETQLVIVASPDQPNLYEGNPGHQRGSDPGGRPFLDSQDGKWQIIRPQ